MGNYGRFHGIEKSGALWLTTCPSPVDGDSAWQATDRRTVHSVIDVKRKSLWLTKSDAMNLIPLPFKRIHITLEYIDATACLFLVKN